MGTKHREVQLCHYCLIEPASTDDHVVPRAIIPKRLKLPGWMLMINRVPACLTCNNRKGSLRADCKCRQCIMAWAVYMNQLHLSYIPDIVSLEYITQKNGRRMKVSEDGRIINDS